MIKKYSSLSSNTTLEFNKKSEREIASVINSKNMKASWFFMILILLSMTTVKKASANNTPNTVFNSSYTYHTVILKSIIAHGHSGGGGDGYAFFSPTDHDKPNCPREGITYKIPNKSLQYINTNKSTNIKTIRS